MLDRRPRTTTPRGPALRIRGEAPADADALAALARGRPVPRPLVLAEVGGRVVAMRGPDGRTHAVRGARAARAVLDAHARRP